MLQITVILVADVFHQFGIGQQMHRLRDRPRFGVDLRVIDSDLNIHVPKIFPPKALGDLQSLGGWFACLIHPGLSVKTFSVDHQGVAFPLTCGVTQPSGSEVLSQLTAIEEDLSTEISGLVDDEDKYSSLDVFLGW